MGIALDQGRSRRIAATGVQGVAKGSEVGAQLIGNGTGAFGGWAVNGATLGPEAAGDGGLRRPAAEPGSGGLASVDVTAAGPWIPALA